MADIEDDAPSGSPPADWQTITPDRSWAEVTRHRGAARTARAEARAAAERVAALEAKLAEVQAAAQRAADLEAQLARTTTRLGMARAGVVDDDLAEVAETRHARYSAAAGKDALPLDQWLAGPAKEDPILGRLLAPAAAPQTPAAPPPKAPVTPAPNAAPGGQPVVHSAEDIARIRAQNGGRLPKAVQEQIGTQIDVQALLHRR